MSRNSDISSVSRRRFLAVAGSVAAASSLAAGEDSSPAQPVAPPLKNCLITIDATGTKLTYKATCPLTNQKDLKINRHDVVTWKVASTGDNQQHWAYIRFLTTTPFAVQEFQWTEKDEATGGFPGGPAPTKGTYEYAVAVFDVKANKLYLDDPKIIVGGKGDAEEEIEEIESDLTEIKEELHSVNSLLKKARKRLKEED